MRWFHKVEHKLERFAVPGLIRIVAGFQLLVFILLLYNQGLYDLISLNPDKVLKGEVWRLVSYIFLPRTSSALWILFQVWFLWFISDGLEQAWGAFRVNLYFLGSMLGLTIGCFLVHKILSAGVPTSDIGFSGEFLFNSLFLAFAVLYPNQTIMLMLILPIKIKYLAYVLAGYLLLMTFSSPLLGVLIAFALTPFFIFSIPKTFETLHLRMQVADRRQKYRNNSIDTTDTFHKCAACGKTENDDPHLEFRVAENDEEYCVPCLDAKKAAEESTPG